MTLHLTLKKKWFDMILRGEKKEEYREFKEYWIKRLGYLYESNREENGYWNAEMKNLPDIIHFTNGYGKHRPQMQVLVTDWEVNQSNHPEWGGDTTRWQFIFKLGEIISYKNCNP